MSTSRTKRAKGTAKRGAKAKTGARKPASDGSAARPTRVMTPESESILVIDVGGNNVKVALGHHREPLKVPSGPSMTARKMVDEVKKLTRDWQYLSVSIGYPGPVKNGRPAREPKNLAGGWVAMDFAKAFSRPIRIANDAALQALGSHTGGRMLFLGLGTGLGSTLVTDNEMHALELGHLPYRKGETYEDHVGERGLKKLGAKKWTEHVVRVVELLRDALQADYVVLGGGQTKKLRALPKDVRLGTADAAILGGVRLWEPRFGG